MRLVFASTNSAKLAEVVGIARRFGIDLQGLDSISTLGRGPVPLIVEGSPSYYDNAREKALAYAQWSGLSCIADDAGLEVHSLGSLPGVYTARFGFCRVRDALLSGVSYEATFRCCMCFSDVNRRTVAVESAVSGLVAFPPGVAPPASSVPYSSYFTPQGETETLAALVSRGSFQSHRALAFRKLANVLDLTALEVDQG